jgi:hypothetical protein
MIVGAHLDVKAQCKRMTAGVAGKRCKRRCGASCKKMCSATLTTQ